MAQSLAFLPVGWCWSCSQNQTCSRLNCFGFQWITTTTTTSDTPKNNKNNRSERSVVFTAFWPDWNSFSFSLSLSDDFKNLPLFYFYKSLALIYPKHTHTHVWDSFIVPLVLPHKVQFELVSIRQIVFFGYWSLRLIVFPLRYWLPFRSQSFVGFLLFFFLSIIHLSYLLAAQSTLFCDLDIFLSCWKWWLIGLIKR